MDELHRSHNTFFEIETEWGGADESPCGPGRKGDLYRANKLNHVGESADVTRNGVRSARKKHFIETANLSMGKPVP